MAKRTWKILPITSWGKWSLGLIIVMPVLFLVGRLFMNTLYPSVPSGDTILADIAMRPALALSMLAGMASGCAAFITGLVAILKKEERSVCVYVSSLVGGLWVLFLIGEVLFPH